ncbi:hypothetical protein TNCV_571471 [Trichonephila clavipes]|nr:hypothetical protein TNCV_571471 [Trichonephila clavipes]
MPKCRVNHYCIVLTVTEWARTREQRSPFFCRSVSVDKSTEARSPCIGVMGKLKEWVPAQLFLLTDVRNYICRQ